MSAENLQVLITYRLEQADQALSAADATLRVGLFREVVNRAYYAMFYAILALLCARGRETSKHSGAISLFDLDYIKPGTFSRDFSRWLHEAFDLRLKSDYAPLFTVSEETARSSLEKAKKFVKGVKAHLEDRLQPPNGG